MIEKIAINLAERSYEILIGREASKELPRFFSNSKYSKIFVITDSNVAKFHLEFLRNILSEIAIPCEIICIAAGENSKSFGSLNQVAEEILAKGIDRKSLIIAFGGGVVGDLSGFLASILLRGIDFIQMPTTLLAMVDSSVGGKTAVNSAAGKNLIGTFYQPKLVICDLDFLATLPIRQMRSGYAEIVKYGFIYDREFFDFLQQNYGEIFALKFEILKIAVKRSCEIKAEIVGRDEREQGERALLNFGHTFGHVFETETGYSDEIFHGEAVAIGMAMAAQMSKNLAMISEDEFLQIKNHLINCGFVIDLKKIRQNWDESRIISHLYKDKKNENQNLTFILLDKIGKGVIKKAVDLQEFRKVFEQFILA